MRFYRVALYEVQDGSHGFNWFTTKTAADQEARRWLTENNGNEPRAEVEPVDIVPTKNGILAALRNHASHAENG